MPLPPSSRGRRAVPISEPRGRACGAITDLVSMGLATAVILLWHLSKFLGGSQVRIVCTVVYVEIWPLLF